MLTKTRVTLLLCALAAHALAGVTGFVNGVYVPCTDYMTIPHTPAPTMVTTPISWAQYQALLHPVPATPIPWVPTPIPTEPAPLPAPTPGAVPTALAPPPPASAQPVPAPAPATPAPFGAPAQKLGRHGRSPWALDGVDSAPVTAAFAGLGWTLNQLEQPEPDARLSPVPPLPEHFKPQPGYVSPEELKREYDALQEKKKADAAMVGD